MESITEIHLGRDYVTIVDSDTFERLNLGRFEWVVEIHKCGAIYAKARRYGFYLHRLILGARPGQIVDHCDRDGLNNRNSNLRLATAGQNRANSSKDHDNRSGFKGVSWAKTSNRWLAQIVKDGVRYYLGVYHHKRRAALAHDRAALALHGEFAGLNFPELKDKLRPRMPIPPKKHRPAVTEADRKLAWDIARV